MKLLILLMFISFPQVWAQADMPERPEGNQEIIHNIWLLHISATLDPITFNLLKDQLSPNSLTKIENLKLKEVETYFSSRKGTTSISLESLSRVDAIQFVSSIEEMSRLSISLSDSASDAVAEAQKEILSASEPSKLSKNEILEIVLQTPDLAYYKNGEYKDSLNLFLLCRENRNYACRFILKDIFGNLVRNSDDSLWSIPALAKSAKNIPFNKTNGQTPTGVHTIDSVMLEANRQISFGAFRRLMLDWIPTSKNDVSTKMFLPSSQHSLNWWKRASIARDAGRLYLRIHGTGKLNSNRKSSWYPHMPTSGCISTREGSYPAAEYTDQRVILDTMMRASQLSPIYSNEVKLKGALWVLNIDNKSSAVSVKDILDLGL
jgi:hypothetical protein